MQYFINFFEDNSQIAHTTIAYPEEDMLKAASKIVMRGGTINYVIGGEEIELEPVEVVTKFKVKRGE